MKRLFLILSLVCLAISGWAGQVSREQALRQAQTFLNKKGISRPLIAAETQLSRRRAQSMIQDYYVFNAGQNEGFVIISGDDRTEAVLGYAEQGTFDIDNLPPALADLLNHYAEQIEDIRNGAPVQTRRASHLKVPEFMTVKWNQTDPYNGKTPLGYYTNRTEGVHTVTGCVATAMAQVLYHQHYVDVTQSEIPGYKNPTSYKTSSGTTVELYVPTIPMGSSLDWANMVDSYNGSESQTQKDAVADLMLYCGAAVKMNYRLAENGGSTASISSVPEAFKRYFGYSKGVRHISRSAYSDTEWDDMIYKEVSVGRPVIYQGLTAKNAGHAFILHGYDSDGKYAVNWGWGGNLDGYFTLDNLTTKQGGYNYSQEAVVYITNDSFSETVKVAVTAIKVDGFNTDNNGALIMPAKTEYSVARDSWGRVPFSLAITFKSALANFYTIDCGYGIHNSNGQLIGNVLKMRTAEFKNGTGWTFGTGNSAFGGDLSVGTYYIKGYSKQSTASDWLLCDDADKFAVKIDVTDSNMSFSVVDISSLNPDPGPEVTDADRTALAASYSELQSYTEKKQAEVTANDNLIAALTTTIVEMKNAAAAIEATITAINTKLTNDTYLSESQKNEFQTQLTSLSDQLSQQNNELAKAIEELTSIESANAALKTQINDLLSQIINQFGVITGITTKADLLASQALADQMTTTANSIDVASLKTRLSAVENFLKVVSFTDMQSGLSNLGQTVDQSIADAIAAAEAAEKAELEAAKASMNEVIDAISNAIANLAVAVENNAEEIANLKTTLAAASEDAKSVADKIEAIKALLDDKYLTETQKNYCLQQLDNYQKELAAYQKSLDDLTKKISAAETSNTALATQIEDLKTAVTEVITKVEAATKKDEVEALKADTEAIETKLKDIDVAIVSQDLTALATALKALSLADTQTALTILQETIQSVIDSAKSDEEKAKEEAEKLEKAKETYQVVAEKLDGVISAHQEIYELLQDAHEKIGKAMTEIEAALAAMKIQYAEIEKALAELIAKQPLTRADDDPIAKLQERLKLLADNIAALESQYEQLSYQIAQLGDHLEGYAALIEKATKTRTQLQDALTYATTADDVDNMTELAGNVSNELSKDGINFYNQFLDSYEIVLDNLNAYIDDINTVYTQANTLQADVEYETTSIQRVAIDESEVLGRYDLKGNRVDSTYKGMQIIRLKNGKTVKINVK
ncbi:MAG: C10 family peptidase [Prevotella sp.]|nr:C10 family peptidase [Prevotella sp.]